MKKKLLSVAVLAAVAAGVNTAQAVYINGNGLGETLIYPYYSAAAGNDTYVNVVNTTADYKAVKVRFVEGMNSVEVLDFNLYLSPFDHWSGVVTVDGEGAKIDTADNSCTVPAIPEGGKAFTNALYTSDSVDGLDRTQEGYVEIIEMGTVIDSGFQEDILHDADGMPGDCASLTAAWSQGGAWLSDPTFGMSTNTGGLYGYGVLINVNEGTDASYDALALDDFNTSDILHARPGDSSPALNDAELGAVVIDGDTPIAVGATSGLDSVSAVFMHDTISNDFVLEPTIQAGTDWVITMPTKHDYVAVDPALPPFTTPWDSDASQACEQVSIVYYDREEQPQIPSGVDFSPRPPQGTFALCWEANVLTFNSSNVLGADENGNISTDLSVIYDNGWMTMGFDAGSVGLQDGRVLPTQPGFEGLPVVGFAVQKYVNGTLVVDGENVLSSYAGLVNHKATILQQ